jgi:hypothetical protein
MGPLLLAAGRLSWLVRAHEVVPVASSISPAHRMTRRGLSILATVGLMATLLAATAGPATGAGPKSCWVKNTTLHRSDSGATGAVLQSAIDAAGSGNTLEVRGRCVGNFLVNGKSLTLIGIAKGNYPMAALDGDLSGSVLFATFSAVVTLRDVLITSGRSGVGGGVDNDGGTVTLSGSTEVTGNGATSGGGISNNGGTVILNDSARVNGNTANFGGGIYNNRGIVTLNGSAQVDGNAASSSILGGGGMLNDQGIVTLNGSAHVNNNTTSGSGGGMFNFAGTLGGGTVTLNDSAQVDNNTASGSGGGIFNDGGTVALNDSSSVSGNVPDDCFAC